MSAYDLNLLLWLQSSPSIYYILLDKPFPDR